MAWRLANSLTKLRNQVNAAYPRRSKVSDGTIGDAAHAAGASDHNPNPNGVVCALDLTHDPANGFDAHALAEHLRVNRHPNLRYIISNARIAGAHTNWQWQPSSGHYQHAHISVGNANAPDGQTTYNYDGTDDWNINYKGASTVATIQNTDNWYARCNDTHIRMTGDPLARNVFNGYVGMDFLRLVEDITKTAGAHNALEWQRIGRLALKDNWQQQIYDNRERAARLEQERNAARDSVQKYVKTIDAQTLELNDLKAKLSVQTDDTKNLNALGAALQWAIMRLGLKESK